GRTPGKRMAGVRIVARDGGMPSAGALLTRNVFRLLDSLPVFYGVGLTATIVTREHLRIGDMAAGTLLVYERADARPPPTRAQQRAMPRLDAAGVEIVAELLERWPTLDVEARAQLARAALARFGAAVAGDTDDSLHAQLQTLLRGPGGDT
ncbi:MAG TPA: RDD family protein, partial [Steroidobacteraceae bacterium]|nr:RDD family protein [Steroidobacteraceae bacterium]